MRQTRLLLLGTCSNYVQCSTNAKQRKGNGNKNEIIKINFYGKMVVFSIENDRIPFCARVLIVLRLNLFFEANCWKETLQTVKCYTIFYCLCHASKARYTKFQFAPFDSSSEMIKKFDTHLVISQRHPIQLLKYDRSIISF